VHGRLAYQRTTFIANYAYYKSMTCGLMQLFFNCFALFSGQTLFNTWTLLGYNTMFTGFGVLFFIFDVDVRCHLCETARKAPLARVASSSRGVQASRSCQHPPAQYCVCTGTNEEVVLQAP
jgi:magnesium-transporting ATPase (P-type)